MKIKAVVPWFGAKRTIAGQIVQHFGKHSAYWEPFCGSLAVLLSKPQCRMETVNDLHGDLVNLLRTIQHPVEGPKLYRRLRRLTLAWEFWDESHRALSKPFEATANRAFHYFVYSWMNRNGVAGQSGGRGFGVRYTKSGGQGAVRFANAVDSIPQWRRRIRNLTILNQDAFRTIERIEDSSGVVIYCDPPYIVEGERYECRLEPGQHKQLAELLCRFRDTRVLVSYYDHPSLDSWYYGWEKIYLDAKKSLANQSKRGQSGSVKAPEILLCNHSVSPSLWGKT